MDRGRNLGTARSLEPMAEPLAGPAAGALVEPLTEPMASLVTPFAGITYEFVPNSTCVCVGKQSRPFKDGTVAAEDTRVCACHDVWFTVCFNLA